MPANNMPSAKSTALWSITAGVPLGLLLLRARLRAKRAAMPSWRELGPASLKNGSSKKKLEALQGTLDVIVVGSGIGGLACAALLSKAGLRVLVCEQHDVAGGSSHTFEEAGFTFDVGVHYVGGQLDRFLSPLRRMWAVATDGKLEWTKSHDTYDVCCNVATGERIEFSSDYAATNRRIKAHFADVEGAAAALARYRRMSLVGQAVGFVIMELKLLPPAVLRALWPCIAPMWRRFGARPVADVLADECGLAGSPGLRRLAGCLTYCYGDYGSAPGSAPWFLHSLVASHYEGGSFFPTGGSASIAKTMVAAIERRGGAVLVRAPVEAVLIEAGRAVGVRCRGVELRARRAVVSDAGFRNTFGSTDTDAGGAAAGRAAPLLPAEAAAAQRRLLQGGLGAGEKAQESKEESAAAGPGGACERVGPSIAMCYAFVGLDATDEELGISAQNHWLLRDFDHDAAFAEFERLELPPGAVPAPDQLPCCFVGAASAKDGAWAETHPGKAAVTVLAPVRPEWFALGAGGKIKHRGAEYDALKAKWQALLLEQLHKQFPATRGRVAHVTVGTPLTNDFYLATTRGEVYGLDHNVARFGSLDALVAQHPQTTVPGLFLTGQDSAAVGVATALMSGFLTAGRISPRALLCAAAEAVVS